MLPSSLKSLLESGNASAIPPSALDIEGFPVNIENFKPAIVYPIYIASTPEKVWHR